MIGRLRQLSERRLRQQAGIEKSQSPVERDILVPLVGKCSIEVANSVDSGQTAPSLWICNVCSNRSVPELRFFAVKGLFYLFEDEYHYVLPILHWTFSSN